MITVFSFVCKVYFVTSWETSLCMDRKSHCMHPSRKIRPCEIRSCRKFLDIHMIGV
jgi:hypothetical protein